MASTATPGSSNRRFLTDLRQAELNPCFTGSVRAVAPGARFLSAPEAPLRATALSLSHLTWSLITPTTAFRTCHPTTSFPVYSHISTKPPCASTGTKVGIRESNRRL